MINVSESTKAAFKSDTSYKSIRIVFPELGIEVGNDRIYHESFELNEAIMDGYDFEFVGCIVSSFSVKIHNIKEDVKNKRIEVYLKADNTEELLVFSGLVDSAKMENFKHYKAITAYDVLYKKGNKNAADWYNSLTFPITLKNFRDSLFEFIDLVQVPVTLPNDNLVIEKQLTTSSLKVLKVIKSICQINGAFGIVNREGNFEYRILKNLQYMSFGENIYPSDKVYPANTIYPTNKALVESVTTNGVTEIVIEPLKYQKALTFEEFTVKPVDKITIRDSEEDAGVKYGAGSNNYIIQGNMFMIGLDDDAVSNVASRIYPNICGIYFYPFSANNNSLPFVECGDAVSYVVNDLVEGTSTTRLFYVFNRCMTGTQAMMDSYSAKGYEYKNEFITEGSIEF